MDLGDCRVCSHNDNGICSYYNCPYAQVTFCLVRKRNGIRRRTKTNVKVDLKRAINE